MFNFLITVLSNGVEVEVFWWEIAASVLSFLLILTFKITPKGSMTRRKRKTLAVMYTAVPAIIPISLGIYGLFNHGEDILLSAMAVVVSVFLVVFRLNRASLVLNK